MTNQEKKEELNKYLEAEAQSARLTGEIARLYSKAEKTTATLSMVPGGGSGENKIEAAVEAIEALAVELGEKQLKATRIRRDIEDAIAAVPDERLRRLLRYRYIDGMKWERIAGVMGYEQRHVTRLHGDALTAISFRSKSCP